MPADLVTADSHQFVFTRDFDAPRELVWQMWTEPKYLTQRVAPPGYSATVRKIDLRPGGAFHIAMRSAEGEEFHISGHYLEVIPPDRVVYELVRSQNPDGDPAARKVIHDVEFNDSSGKTRVTLSLSLETGSIHEMMLQSGGDKAMASSLDRVAELLAKLQSV